MTKINKLVMHGFKSFATKTEVDFTNDFNVILGPNGSGKSNVLDALCFVLGRMSAKSMRAEKASNLIFNGGKKKKAADKGEVHIYMDNKSKIFPFDTPEVKISRIVRKKGNSIYKINGKTHTRGEVVDLLSKANVNPDGHNIILQGDIVRFVQMPSVERRKVIEEISGISVYEEKKHKAINELGRVESKFNDAEIVLKERNTYLKELKKDRDQALKFKELENKIASHKATYLHKQISTKSKEKEAFDKQIGEAHAKLAQTGEKVKSLRQEIGVIKEQVTTINKEIEHKGEKEQVELHRDIEDLKVTLAKKKTRISGLKDELVKIQQRKDQLQKELRDLIDKTKDFHKGKEELLKRKANIERELSLTQGKIESFKKKHKLNQTGDIEVQIETLDKSIEEKQEKAHVGRAKQQDLLREKDKIEFQLDTLDKKIEKVKEVEKENKQQLSELKKFKENFKRATLELNKLLDEDSTSAAQMANSRKRLVNLHEQEAKLRAKTIHAQERASADIAVKRVLGMKKAGVFGTIADLGKVKSTYSTALEMAAGPRVKSIVVDSDRTAAECIKYLKNNRLGAASFIPLNKIRTPSINPGVKKLASSNGCHGFATDLMSYDTRFARAFLYVFGDTLVVENIDVARRLGIGVARMVTLDGDLAETSGVMKGGYTKRRASGVFKEVEAENDLKSIQNDMQKIQSLIKLLEGKKEQRERSIQDLRTRKHELEGDIIKLEKILHIDTADIDATKKTKEGLRSELASLDKELTHIKRESLTFTKELATLKGKKHVLRGKISQLKNPRLLAELSAFEEAKANNREELIDIDKKLTEANTRLNELFTPEQVKINKILKQHEKEDITFKEELKSLSSEVTIHNKALVEKENASKKFYSQYKGLFAKRDKLNTDISKKESTTEKLQDQNRRIEIDMNKQSLRLAELKARLSGLEQEFEHVKAAPLLKGKSEEELKLEISKFERMKNNMSAVNLRALEIYENVEKEYTKLLDKKQKLAEEKEDILGMMEEIEVKKTEQFFKTFKKIDKTFQTFFQRLSTKGSAFLELENPKKPFEGGMNVKVKLTGSRFMDIRSLSGGEKTMTALAFIFSVQEHEPSSFYVLDEVDAALDKHNSEKLAQLIRGYVDRAQYIVISHNDNVISEADTLYGVSMNEFGVTKVTSLKL